MADKTDTTNPEDMSIEQINELYDESVLSNSNVKKLFGLDDEDLIDLGIQDETDEDEE